MGSEMCIRDSLENGDLPLKVLALAAFVAVDGEDLIVLFFAG